MEYYLSFGLVVFLFLGLKSGKCGAALLYALLWPLWVGYIDIHFLGNRIDILTDSLIGVIRIPQNLLWKTVIAFPLLFHLCCVFVFDGTKL